MIYLSRLGGTSSYNYYQMANNYSVPAFLNLTVSKATSVDGYTPKNRKLLTSEYCYLLGSNRNGGTVDYKYENFKTSNCQFQASGIPVPRWFYNVYSTKL